MLFKDILEKKAKQLEPEFDKLFNLIIQKQHHSGDLLLVLVNGCYDEEIANSTTLGVKLSPYTIGPHKEGHSESCHYEFIHQYRTTHLAQFNHSEYLEMLNFSPEKRQQIFEFQKMEGTTIQLEMLIYLKIWEADSFIKRFYQLVRLVKSESYDWYFKLSESNRDSSATGTRQDIIRLQIRDRIEKDLPSIYLAFKNAYLTQVRNSIAHSNYSISSRYIQLNNYIKKDPASQLISLSFDEWIDKFHDTMIIYDQYIK
ncbi:MAG: hypothetical protein J7604_06995, partial [Sporocytophaga sp.]|uniref:hypothetical protein n=1 Tax=Sporocytophaga sp. TaxID=2231183 RepID=UPI001AFEC28F